MGIALSCNRKCRTVSLSQTALIDYIITQFSLLDEHPITIPMNPGLRLSHPTTAPMPTKQLSLFRLPYHSLVGSLMYIALGTRPDIAYAVQQLCHYLNCYRTIHLEAAKHVVCYLKGTFTLMLTLGGDHAARLLRHTDSDFTACVDT